MICPINRKGGTRDLLKSLTSPINQSPVWGKIKSELDSFPEYYEQAYPEIKGMGEITRINYFYDKVKNIKGRIVDNAIVGDKVTPIFPKGSRVSNQEYKGLDSTLETLKGLFNFPYIVINDKNQRFKGKYVNHEGHKYVIINTAYATADTPFHEYFHPFVRLLTTENPELFNKISEEASFIKGDREEAVTEYLGKIAASTYRNSLFQRFVDFISSVISKYLNIKFKYSPSDTVKDIVNKLLTEGYDVSSEQTLSEAFQLLDAIDSKTNAFSAEDGRDKALLKQIKNDGSFLTTSDSSDYYEGKNKKYRRLTNFTYSKLNGAFTFIFPNRKSRDANIKATEYFKAKKAPLDSTVEFDGNQVKFDDLVSHYERLEKAPILRGKLTHSFIESLIKEGDESKKAREDALNYAKELGTPFIDLESHPDLKVIAKEWEDIASLSGITKSESSTKYNDVIESEITVFSDIMKDSEGNPIASTIDLLLHKYNGDMALVDFKSGNILSDYGTPMLMPYGEKLGVKDSKLNHAFLELAFRAIMLKEKNPDTKISFLRIVKTDKYSQHQAFDADLGLFLQVIGNYYQKTNPAIFKELSDKGLLDYKNYAGTSTAFSTYTSQLAGKSKEEAIAFVNAKLAEWNAAPYQGKQPDFIRDEIKTLTEMRLELEGYSDIKVDLTKDKSPLGAALSTLSDIDKNSVKGLNSLIVKARQKTTDERNKIYSEWDSLLNQFYKERPNYLSETNWKVKGLSTLGILYGVTSLNPLLLGISLTAAYFSRRANTKTKETFDFLYKKSDDPDSPGYYLNTTDFHEGRKLTDAERNLRDYYINTMKSLYKETMSEVVDIRKGYPVTKAQMMGLPAELPNNFIARPPKTLDELKEDYDLLSSWFGIKPWLSHSVRSNLVSMLERGSSEAQKDTLYYPMKNFHLGGKVVEAELHSFNADMGFKLMVENLLHKKHFDELYPVAQGVRNLVADSTVTGKEALPNLLKALDSHIMMQVQNKEKEIKLRTDPITYRVEAKTAALLGVPQGTYEINQDKLARSLRTGLGFTTMAFKVMSASKNLAIIALTNGIKASTSFTNKLFGVNTDDESITKAVLLSNKDMLNYWKDLMSNNKRNNKLYLLAEAFDWMPDNSSYGIAKNNLLKDLTKPGIASSAFMFHNFVETYGALSHLSATLRAKYVTVNGKKISLYDAYQVEDGKLVWKAGIRGKTKEGEELSSLDAKEIKSLKREYERTQGSYRPEERTAIESTILGQFLMQFKKYFFTYLKNQVGSRVDDVTIGSYKEMQRPDGTSVFEWENQIMEGRLRVIVRGIVALFKRDKTFLQGRQGEANRRRLAEFATMAFWITTLLIMHAGFDDDDDKTTKRERLFLDIVKDASSGFH